ncbi:MAG: phosphotransferase [Tabrizicola sp.]|nr:phosphotransferase [Tabrizicola sp.]
MNQGAAPLQALAEEAAGYWDGRAPRLISHRENAVFEIALPVGRAALRLHRAGYQSEAAIRSELWWCAALAAKGVGVAAALPSREGALLQRLSSGHLASAIAWVEGAPLGQAGEPLGGGLPSILGRHRDLGRLVAAIHDTTDRLVLPPGFTRPRWDIDGLVGEHPFWGRFWDHPAATPDQAAVLRQARDFLRDRLAVYQGAAPDIGPIHADVLRENVLVNGNSLSLIDFDDCGIGFRLYDLGTVLSQNLHEPGYSEIRLALIEGYGETRAAPPDLVDLFTLARTCASVGWTMPRLRPDDPIHASHIARAVRCAGLVAAIS